MVLGGVGREMAGRRDEAFGPVTAVHGLEVRQSLGGFGDSGSAFKPQGLGGLRFHTRVKTVATFAGL